MAEIQKANQGSKKKTPAKQTKVVIQTGEEEDEEESRKMRGPTKWYMGQYGNNDGTSLVWMSISVRSSHARMNRHWTAVRSLVVRVVVIVIWNLGVFLMSILMFF